MISTRLTTKFTPCNLIQFYRPKKLNRLCLSTFSNEEEYTEKPEYPPVLDLTHKEVKKRDILSDQEKYRRLNTVEEKLFAINLPRYYGWDSLILKEGKIPFNVLPFIQYITRTKLTVTNNLPIDSVNISEQVLNDVRPQIQEAIVLEFINKRHRHETLEEKLPDTTVSDIIAKNVIEHIHRILLTSLSSEFPHLENAETDFDPRIEAFWKVGNFYPDNETYETKKKELKKQREEKKKELMRTKEKKEFDPEEPVDHWIQYFGEPCVQLRHSLPLGPLGQEVQKVERDVTDEAKYKEEAVDNIVQEVVLPVPTHRYHPGYYGITQDKRQGTNIPGFWPGDPNEFGLLSYHTRGHIHGRPPNFGAKDSAEAIHAQGILAGFGWLLGQACYQGFSTYNDVTYPLTTSTVITDGRLFSFYTSQVNTLLMYADYTDTNPKENVCYGTQQMELYKHIDGGQIFGWNDAPLKTLLSFYMNVPRERKNVNLKPFLHGSERYLCDIEDEKRRVWLHQQFRHMYANRPRKILPYEIYDWEQIYKIKFKTRHLDARRRPFELGKNPLVDRKYSDHVPKYIRKSIRDPLKKKQKFEDTYYPDV